MIYVRHQEGWRLLGACTFSRDSDPALGVLKLVVSGVGDRGYFAAAKGETQESEFKVEAAKSGVWRFRAYVIDVRTDETGADLVELALASKIDGLTAVR